MNYKQLDDKMKVKIDFLLEKGLSLRACARELGISHSTISRYKNNVYKKREINIQVKYKDFLDYLYKHYDWRCRSIEVCVHQFKKYNSRKKCVSVQQVYNWINNNKIDIKVKDTCYKRNRRKGRQNGMMAHLQWNLEHKTVFPISLRPKYIENRDEIGHLEIDTIVGKRNEYDSIISIVDRCSRMMWLIKADYKHEHYVNNLIYNFIKQNDITVKSITTDNGKEFAALGICAKRLNVKLYKCDPYCSFQRGTNERMNALVRRFLPKGKSFIQVGQQYLEDISFKINSMPRKIFDFKTPYEIDFIHIKNGAVEI
jgi:IS30 family transposase